MRVGGPADAFLTVGDRALLRRGLRLLGSRNMRWMMIGYGTNVLPSDLGFRGAVVKLAGEFEGVSSTGENLSAGAATSLSRLLESALAGELGGVEFLTGIPGCVGGALPGNAGSATESIGDRVEEVEMMMPDGSERRLGAGDVVFTYRHSNLREMGGVILGVKLKLQPCSRAEVENRVRDFAEKRKGQPVKLPNVGCIFKNPPGESAGRLIDGAGLKGARSGDAEVSSVHANFMVNSGKANAADVIALIRLVREKVSASAGVTLAREIVVIDELGEVVEC